MEGRRGSGCREEGCRGEGFMWGKVHTGLILIQSSEIRQRLKQSAIWFVHLHGEPPPAYLSQTAAGSFHIVPAGLCVCVMFISVTVRLCHQPLSTTVCRLISSFAENQDESKIILKGSEFKDLMVSRDYIQKNDGKRQKYPLISCEGLLPLSLETFNKEIWQSQCRKGSDILTFSSSNGSSAFPIMQRTFLKPIAFYIS